MTRETDITAFLTDAGCAGQPVTLLAGDASPRRYLRVGEQDRTRVLMDAPPSTGEDVVPFAAVTHWLRQAGLNAPELHAADAANGFLLIEDLGDDLYARVLETDPSLETTLYAAAVDVLVHLGSITPPARFDTGTFSHALQPYDLTVLLREAALLREWWLPAANRATPSQEMADEFDGLVTQATAHVAKTANTVVMRDYHAENLIWLPTRSGLHQVGLLDYQDALAGHPAYDLMSLLEDARRDTSPELQATMIDRYLTRCPSHDRDAFLSAYAALGAQRNLKIIGIFARLAIRDAKPRYLDLIPRVWRHLQHDLAHPDLAPLARWVNRHVPAPEPHVLERIKTEVTG